MVAMVPQSSAPSIVTSNSSQSAQQMLMQAMLQQLPQQQQQTIAAAMQLQARRLANQQYMRETIRKLAPALTNGALTQSYALNTPMTFNIVNNTALNAYMEGFIIRASITYTLAAGTSATYAATAAGAMGLIDSIIINYNKTQDKIYPAVMKELALAGAFNEWTFPYSSLPSGFNADPTLSSYLSTGIGTAVGTNTTTFEIFVPFNLINSYDARGLLPMMAGDTGIQVVVNTPLAILGPDPRENAIYSTGGTGAAISAVGGTIQVYAVYRDGDTYEGSNKLPFDISALEGTFQMQADTPLTPLVAGQVQRTKLNIMGQHYYVVLLVIDGNQSNAYCADNNIVYLEFSKDGVGGNTFQRFGNQTNTLYNDYLFLNRMQFNQDVDPGVIPWITAPLYQSTGFRTTDGKMYLDNTKTGWPDSRYGVQVNSVGTVCGPRIEPYVFYINPIGLVAV
jgi:hypothetical protein